MNYDRYSKAQLIDMLVELKWDFEHLQTMFEKHPHSCEGRNTGWSNHYVLFQSFVNDTQKCLVLIDTSYQVCYINHSAKKLLRIRSLETTHSRKIFDFMKHADALKLKEMIDRAYLRGNKQNCRGLQFITPNDKHLKIDASATRVRFKDQTAVQLMLKTA